ncbi:nSTAND3 domain-containing NTPase [Rhizobium leguminosarum]|uniref:nSTAND3 domain-containing NTPase n=1 Tax=Rhizobium leguminosarum TaxID=384 RepID=UPI001C9610AD|nr:hypothetical protein [Rhizobium leguminosarum]MBY5751420.1 hypothetical protein [Rhizobium leguminosarum]
MNIAITGQQKYDFQDLVCAETMLSFVDDDTASLLVEPAGGEDGELHAGGKTFEIQVKGATGAVGLDHIANVLAHFPADAASGSLLERILSDEDRYGVLVMSGRCDDASSVLVTTSFPHGPAPLARVKVETTKTLVGALRKAANAGNEPTVLEKKRQEHLLQFLDSLKPAALRQALQRVFVFERVDDVTLQDRFAHTLSTRYLVPLNRVPDAIRRFRELVKNAKALKTDALPEFRATLSSIASASVRPAGYIDRGLEEDWVARLERDRALLVTGRPRAGKSYTAFMIASRYQSFGYDVLRTSDISSTERYLEEPARQARMAVLEDPLGGAAFEPDGGRILARIAKLIGRLPPEGRLIVVQSQEQLLAASLMSSVTDLKSGGVGWVELSDSDPDFVKQVWLADADEANAPAELENMVSNALRDGAIVLSPGAASFVAANHADLVQPFTLDGVRDLAAKDSTAIGTAWAAEGLRPVARALALGSSASEDIDRRELAFILGSGGQTLPGKPKGDFDGLVYGGDESRNAPDPTYDSEPELSEAQERQVDLLEERNLVLNVSGKLRFSHPIYVAAARFASGGTTQQQAADLYEGFRRAIFSADPKTAAIAAKNADWIYDRLAGRREQGLMLEVVEMTLRGYYPSVRDACFSFLLRRFGSLAPDVQKRLPDWVGSVTKIDISSLEWRNGNARIPLGKSIGFRAFELDLVGLTSAEVASERSILEGASGGYLSVEGATRALLFYKQNPSSLTLLAAGRLLAYDEGFIRGELALVWLSVERMGDQEIIDRVARDDHPGVAVGAIEGAVKGWNLLTPARRAQITNALQTQGSNAPCAAAILPDLVRFNRVEFTGSNPPWPLFGALMPVALKAAPAGAVVSEPRLFSVVRDSVPKLGPEIVVEICDAWIDWIERELGVGSFRGEYSVGVLEILIVATRTAPEKREGRLDRILSLPGTSVVHSALTDAVDGWHLLTPEERRVVENLLFDNRSDALWLQAAVLTRSNPPLELQRRILGGTLTLEANPETLIAEIPAPLFDACIHSYTGWIGRLWNKAHRGEEVWAPVIAILGTLPEHSSFSAAWFELTLEGDGKPVAAAIRVIGAERATMLIDTLTADKVDRTGDFMPEAWAAVLNFAHDREARDALLTRTLAFLPAILEDIKDLQRWLPAEDHPFILHALKGDLDALQIAQHLSSNVYTPKALSVLKVMMENRLPTIHGTYTRLSNMLSALKADSPDFFEWLEERRHENLESHRGIRESLRISPPNPLGWIDP